MGRGQSKLLGLNFGQSRSESKDPAGRALFTTARSNSMDSISTAVSLQTHQSIPTHSSSLTDLHLSSQWNENGTQTHKSNTTRVEDGRSYVLLNTGGTPAALPNAKRGDEKEGRGREERERKGGEHERRRTGKERERRKGRERGKENDLERDKGGKRLTQSLPAAVEVHAEDDEALAFGSHVLPRRRSEPDNFSDNFIASEAHPLQTSEYGLRSTDLVEDSSIAPAPVEGALAVRGASLKGLSQYQPAQLLPSEGPEANSSAPCEPNQALPVIPTEILQKLSRDEWNTVVSVTCTTLQQTLQSSIDEQLSHDPESRNAFQNEPRGEEAPPATNGYMKDSDENLSLRQWENYSDCPECRECGLERYSSRNEPRAHRSKRKNRRERPNSLPPLYLRSTIRETAEEPGSSHDDQDISPSRDVPMRRRSRSHENCFFYRCQDPSATEMGATEMGPASGSGNSRRRKQCECRGESKCEGLESSSSSCSSGSSGHRKRRVARPTTMERVDTSIDDDCPRVFENRVRRKPRHSAACERCKGQRKPQRHSSDRDGEINMADFTDHTDPNVEYVDLGQLKTWALLESVALRLTQEGSDEGVATDVRKHRKLKSKHPSINLEEVPRLRATIKLDDSFNLKELLYPMQSRTGRDSPRTDMAVAGLDMTSAQMFERATRTSGSIRGQRQCLYRNQGLSVSDSSLSRHQVEPVSGTGNEGSTDMRVIHQHHHFHHIVHHSQP